MSTITIQERPLTRTEAFRGHYSPQEIEFIKSRLRTDELDIIDQTEGMDARDYLPIALTDYITKTKNHRLITRFGNPHYLDPQHQRESAAAWFAKERAIVEQRMTEQGQIASWSDVMHDFEANGNGLRHRIWYALRFPDKVQLNRKTYKD